MTDFLFFAFAAAYCAVACYLDLKKRIIPDWLTYGGIAAGLAFGAANCIYLGTPFAVHYALMLAVALALGYALFLTGAWAGGDAKLFWAFSALFGAAGRADAILPVALFACSALLFIAVTFALNAGTLLRKRKACARIAFETAKKAAGAAAVASLFASGLWNELFLVASVAVIVLLVRLPKYAWPVILLASIAINADAAATAFPAAFAIAFSVGTLARVSLEVVSPGLSYRVRKSDLEEGMLPAYTIIERDGKAVLFKPKLDWKRIVKAAGKGGKDAAKILQDAGLVLPANARVVADASDAGGLDGRQLQRLKKLENVRWLQVRTTQAFAPVLCACFLAALAGLF